MSSTFGHRDAVDRARDATALHAQDAAARGIVNGDRVRLFNDRGSVLLTPKSATRYPQAWCGLRVCAGRGGCPADAA